MVTNLKEMADREILRELHGRREALRVFRFGSSGSKVKNVKEGKNIRKEIARLLTELNSRRIKLTAGR